MPEAKIHFEKFPRKILHVIGPVFDAESNGVKIKIFCPGISEKIDIIDF